MNEQGPELRIGDAEREAAVAALGDHYAAGRLTKEEYDERSALAWAAKTSSALWPLFADLPRTDNRSAAEPSPRGHRPGPGRPWWTVALVPVLMVLILVTALTHLPIILLAVVLWLLWARRSGMRRRSYWGRRW